jgi:hypothetical protein
MLGVVLGERMLDRIVSPSFHVSRICGPKIGRSFHTTASQTLHTFPWCLSVGRFRSSRTKSVSFCWAGESCVVVAATATTDFQIRQRCDSSSEAFWVFMKVSSEGLLKDSRAVARDWGEDERKLVSVRYS